jgi:phosphoglycerate dehydrogenase-like enzyme
LAQLRERGVQVFNVHANAFDVAEKALALCLAYTGGSLSTTNDLNKELWHGFWVKAGAEDNWNSIYGKTCAILGTGAVGQALARLLKAFSCEVIGWRRRSGQAVPMASTGWLGI